MRDLAIVRSMRTREGDHGRATYHLRTGYTAQPPIQFPVLGSVVAKEREQADADLPRFVSIGDFGRTPIINPRNGRDHYPAAWSVVLGGGGIRGGQVVGRTSAGGNTVEDRPVVVSDLLATICLALGLDPARQNMSNVGRPIRLAEPGAEPLREILV